MNFSNIQNTYFHKNRNMRYETVNSRADINMHTWLSFINLPSNQEILKKILAHSHPGLVQSIPKARKILTSFKR